jgi:tetratricopeptide (TPR) repeat protein
MLSISQNPNFIVALNLANTGDFQSAIKALLKLNKKFPADPILCFYLGLTYLNLEEFKSAEKYLKISIKLDSGNYLAHQALGTVYYSLENHDSAIRYFDNAIQLNPEYPDVYNDKALSLMALNRHDDAIPYVNYAIELDPHYVDAISNQGIIFFRLGRYLDAINSFDRAIEQDDNLSEVFGNKGVTLAAIRQFEGAIDCYNHSLALKNDNAESHRFLSLLYLAQFKFEEGWREFEWRFLAKSFGSTALSSSKKKWDGLDGKRRLFVWSEQGLGDQVLFASMLINLLTLSPQITLRVNKKLLPLFKRSFPRLTVISKETKFEDYDEHIAIGSLGQFFRPNVESFPKTIEPYLIEDPLMAGRMRSLNVFAESKVKIKCGISWRSINKDIGDEKSIALNQFSQILNSDHIAFINLQYGDVTDDIASLDSSLRNKIDLLEDFDLYNDIDAVVSAINACDVIVTISNTTAHLAGALGKKTLLLLPYSVGQIWYWNAYNGRCLWYPSITFFQQIVPGDWSEPLYNVKKYLEENFD